MDCVMALSDKGVPILKEKPVTECMDEFRSMSALPVKIGVTFQKRFEPQFIHLKNLLPLAGDVATVQASLTLNIEKLDATWRASSGVGTAEDLGCHMLDIVTWMFGAPSSVMTYGVSPIRPCQVYGGDDISDVIMDWEGINRTGHVHMSRVAYDFSQSITVTGSNGYLILDGSNIVHRDSRGHETLRVVHNPVEKDVIRSMVQEFGDWVTGKRPDFLSSLESLTETVSVMDAVKSSLSGRKIQRPLRPMRNTRRKLIPHSNKEPFNSNRGQRFLLLVSGTRRAQRPGEIYQAVQVALQAGYRSIDTAQSSGNEDEIGKAIFDSGIPREEIWITTKLDNQWHNRVDRAIEASLKALKVDYVDLYLMHWPMSTDPDDLTKQLPNWSFVDTWQQMQLISKAKVRNVGVSNFGVKHLETLLNDETCHVTPAVNQIELHPYWKSRKLLEYCHSHGIHCTAYSCLGSSESALPADPTLLDIARARQKTPQQILIMWGLHRGTSVIPKSVHPLRIKENFNLDGWALSDEEMNLLGHLDKSIKTCRDDWLPGQVFQADDG
ncbi:Aldo/keto reductase [Penicillium expansum]|nr:Aldo/keto reductase [Penicillium expansum]